MLRVMKNRFIGHTPTASGWFYLLSTKNIIGSDAIKMKEKSSTLSADEEREIIRIISYLEEHNRNSEISRYK